MSADSATRRGLVDVEPDAVAGRVRESLFESGRRKRLAASCVDLPAGDASLNGAYAGALRDIAAAKKHAEIVRAGSAELTVRVMSDL